MAKEVEELIGIACDQAGYDLKLEIIEHLQKRGLQYVDLGTDSKEPTDYPIYAKRVAEKLLSTEIDKGILICGTGIGISIAANRYEGIRAALCHDTFSAKATRLHNDANILAMGARVIGASLAIDIVDAFLDTPFSNEDRHIKRIKLIEK